MGAGFVDYEFLDVHLSVTGPDASTRRLLLIEACVNGADSIPYRRREAEEMYFQAALFVLPSTSPLVDVVRWVDAPSTAFLWD